MGQIPNSSTNTSMNTEKALQMINLQGLTESNSGTVAIPKNEAFPEEDQLHINQDEYVRVMTHVSQACSRDRLEYFPFDNV